MSFQYSLTKTWTLLRYAVEINPNSPLSSPNSTSSNERQQPQRQAIDCSEGYLSLNLSKTQQLYVIRDETEKIECVDLLSSDPSSIFATYTGDSLLISYLIPNDNIQRKFLIKFASTASQNGRQHCEECVRLLSRSINITHFDSISLSSITNSIEKPNSIVSISDMIKSLMGDNAIKLSKYYNQELAFDNNQTDDFLEKYLCDETFPDFVANVASILDTMKET
ncbi:unnamed protein product [Rotaria sp. Silwood1]|nr:unnamed protein product [Rotaria sp. Silwood1]CAF0948944.1 unnamed protein product [Rotaria sp. Silwood1]CAF3361354.1 unnamed protein product [Rotaria sp. Silwood1]CAF3396533.1 unnamed protein product [Rotaria sp. Silwood1]CAF4488431.1 unnamed protein product [Rotaria sp. Silwood1]